MPRKLADDFAKTNAEFEKLKSSRPDDVTPRETPQHQAPGTSGLRRPDFDRWTTEELRAAAATLGVEDVDSLGREDLIERLSQTDPS